MQVLLNAWLFARLEDGRPLGDDAEIYDRVNTLLIFPVLAGIFVTAVLFLRWLHLVAGVLCIRVIRELQGRLDAHRDEAMNPS